MAELAYVFQQHSGVDELRVPLRAAANIMLYLSPDAASQQVVKDRLRFLRGDVDPNSLDAILDLRTELSAYCAEGKAMSPDQELEPLALVVPKKRETPVGDKLLSCVLPGAPRAYVSLSGVDDFPDASKLVEFCDQNDFLKSTHADLTRYLESSVGRNIRSMSSFQVITRNGQKNILNIHSNRTNLELGSEWVEQFHALIAPFSIVLADLLDQLVGR